jgi:hypothetical protein
MFEIVHFGAAKVAVPLEGVQRKHVQVTSVTDFPASGIAVPLIVMGVVMSRTSGWQ